MDTWLTTIAPRTVSQSTLDRSYLPKVRRWIIPRLGKRRLDRLEPEYLDAFYAWLATQHLKPNTILQIHRILSRALKIAWKRGKTGRNVATMVDAPVGEEVEIEPLTRDEARQRPRKDENRQVRSAIRHHSCNPNCNQKGPMCRTQPRNIGFYLGGAGGTRTHDRRIMSPLL